MHDAVSALSITTESVRDNLYQKIAHWLLERDANPLPEKKFKYTEQPWFSSQEAHSFSWLDSRRGWMDILRSSENILQVVVNLRYPKKRFSIRLWGSRYKKDWHRMNDEAEYLFGQGQSFRFPGKEGMFYEGEGIKVLIASYTDGKDEVIEIKAARENFCS